MTRGIGGPNRPPQKPAKLMSDAQKADSSAKPEAEAKAAPKTLPAPGKGKEPVKVTPEELKAVREKEKKWEEKRLAEAIKDSEATYKREQANRAAGVGTSGVAHEKPTPPPTPKDLSRNNSDISSTSSFGTPYSAPSLPSTSPDSPLPRQADWPDSPKSTTSSASEPTSEGPARYAKWVGGDPSSEPSTPGRPHSPPNWGKIHDETALKNAEFGQSFSIASGFSGDRYSFNEDPRLHGNKGGHWVDQYETPHVHISRGNENPLLWRDFPHGDKASRDVPPPPFNIGPDRHAGTGLLSDPVGMPDLHSGPTSPTTQPGPMPGQGPTYTHVETRLPTPPHETPQEPLSPIAQTIPAKPEKKDALGALGPKATLGLGALAITTAAALTTTIMLASGSDDSSKEGDGAAQA